MKTFIVIPIIILAICSLANQAIAQMTPLRLSLDKLPFKAEGYTVLIDGERTFLYNDYSNLPARNIFNNGGIQIEVDFSTNMNNPISTSPGKNLATNSPYNLRIKISKGNNFDGRKRINKNLYGPSSQVIMHLPGSIELVGSPTITVDGRTVSQQMVHNLWSLVAVGIPGGGSVGAVLTNMIIDAIAGALGDRAVEASFRRFKPSTRIEVSDNMNFPGNENHTQVLWKLGGWNYRALLNIKTAEIVVPVRFTKMGSYDLSIFFNIWGQHTLTGAHPLTGTQRGVFHSLRQHCFLRLEVDHAGSDNISRQSISTVTNRQSLSTVSGRPEDRAAYFGRLWDGVSRNPYPGANVIVVGPNNEVLAHTKTSTGRGRENGTFQLLNLPINTRIQIVAFHDRVHSNIVIKEVVTKPGFHDLGNITTRMEAPETLRGKKYNPIIRNINRTLRNRDAYEYAKQFSHINDGAHFVVSRNKYPEKENLARACAAEFGEGYTIADWNDIKLYADDIESLARHLDLPGNKTLYLTRDGNRFYAGNRHYFVTYHNHVKPGHYLAHDQINNHYLSLGSWHNVSFRVLCKKR